MESRPVYVREEDQGRVVPSIVRRMSWGAVLAGAVVALATMAVFGALGMAVGLAAVQPNQSADTLQGITIAAGVYGLISVFIAFMLGGWVSGRLSVTSYRDDRWLHGFATWAVSTVALVWLVGAAGGGIFAGGMSALGGGIQSGQIGVSQSGTAGYSFGSQEARASTRVSAEGNTADGNRDINAPQLTEAEMRAAAAKAADVAAIGAGWTFAAQLLSLLAVTIGAKLHRAYKAVEVQETPPGYIPRASNL